MARTGAGSKLHHLANQGLLEEVVDHLKFYPDDVNTKGLNGYTALHIGAMNGFYDLCVFLISKNADINSKDEEGWTPLHMAIGGPSDESRVCKRICNMLLDHGADINAKDNDGEVPLFTAAQKGFYNICELLLDRGAEIDIKNNEEHTALTWAVLQKNFKLRQLLIERGANEEYVNARQLDFDMLYRSLNDVAEDKNYFEALKIIEIALKRYPNDPMFIGVRALVYEAMEDIPHALESYEQAYITNPTSATRLNNYALLLEKIGDLSRAESLYMEAITLEPTNTVYYTALGDLYETMNKRSKAVACYNKALEMDPNNFLAHNNLIRFEFNKAMKRSDATEISRLIQRLRQLILKERNPQNIATIQQNIMSMQGTIQRISNNICASPCAVCKAKSTKRCGKCQGPLYCSKECQLSHWKEHKKTCGKVPTRHPGEFVCTGCRNSCDCFLLPHLPTCSHSLLDGKNSCHGLFVLWSCCNRRKFQDCNIEFNIAIRRNNL